MAAWLAKPFASARPLAGQVSAPICCALRAGWSDASCPSHSGGYRYYSEETIARLVFVRNAIRFGFSSKELAEFLKARDSGHPPCRSVRAAGQRLISEIDEQLARLRDARAAMADTLAAWDARLERTPTGSPAHLLSMIPDTSRAARRQPVNRRRRTR
jgi:DNA-binding transcriptional MerR regulator